MQQNTRIALNEGDLQTVTGGMNDGVVIGGGAAAAVGGATVGAVAGAAATRLKMQESVKHKIIVLKDANKTNKLDMRNHSRTVRQTIHNLGKAASRV